jgi:hypothetical protein
MSSVASFHLLRWRGNPAMFAALAFDRVRYRGARGLRFLRVLGTGHGSSTAPGTQFGRTALFALFDDDSCADEFTARVRERNGLAESWHVKLRGAGGHGSWRGREIPKLVGAASDRADASSTAGGGALAMITRADVRAGSWRTFSREARIVDAELQASEGLLAVVGIGEAPILRLGTFSLWRDAAAMTNFARRRPEHLRVVGRTRREKWYGEEMFARFKPYDAQGTWDGRDPLRG